jgi:hypothetical protein
MIEDTITTSSPLRFETVTIILSSYVPDHEQDDQVLDGLHEEVLC